MKEVPSELSERHGNMGARVTTTTTIPGYHEREN